MADKNVVAKKTADELYDLIKSYLQADTQGQYPQPIAKGKSKDWNYFVFEAPTPKDVKAVSTFLKTAGCMFTKLDKSNPAYKVYNFTYNTSIDVQLIVDTPNQLAVVDINKSKS